MKNVLFVCYGLGIGGIEKCLVNFINTLPENIFSIDLLLMNPEYDMLTQIKRDINLLDSFRYVMNTTDTSNEIKKRGGYKKHIIKTAKYALFRLCNKFNCSPWKLFEKTNKEYDVAIAYSHHDFSPKYVIDKVKAKKKAVWYHNGKYEEDKKHYKTDKKYFNRFDNVVAVSNDCADSLRKAFPEFGEKLIVLRNFCDTEDIIKKSTEFYPKTYNDKITDIVTVGRLTPEKGADLALEVCKLLKDKGMNFCWHWVGDGNQREKISQLITKNSLEDCFVLEGNQPNPYPFIKYADVYVQPSYYEAYSTTITEAKVLCKPIVTTDVGGMRDQLIDRINGLIVPINASLLYKAILEIISTDLSLSFEAELGVGKFTNSLDDYNELIFGD